jgi:RNA polymerase sigma-70 factor, ECF subfamily
VATAARCSAAWPTRWAPERPGPTCYVLRVGSAEDLPDDELVRRIATRGPDAGSAEQALCRRFAPRIRLYGLRHLRDEDRARDLVQTVLLGVIEACRAGRVEEADKIDRYVLGTCRNAAGRMREADARLQPLGEGEVAGADLAGGAVIAVSDDVEPIDRRMLVRCLSMLETRASRILMLSFQEDRTADEIAAMLAMAPGNVRVVRHRALAALRRCFDQGGEVRS